MSPDPHNHTFQLASEYINSTAQSVFLTGRAGTGKTTFLRHIRQNTPKQHVVLAPTGVAAINAGGTTLHSFFQLPFSPFIPMGGDGFGSSAGSGNGDSQDAHSLIKKVKFNRDKRELILGMELLIIDEISMVRADVLDAIDTLLRYFRGKPTLPFGGVQMLFIGDMFQLPPVVPNQEWSILREYYQSPFFFDCLALKKEAPVYIELQKIYRQSDDAFINLLNQVRNNHLQADGKALLLSRFKPGFEAPKTENYVTLCSHNAGADAINNTALRLLTGKPFTYSAEITGEFAEKSYPADALLQLKPGAQVMFIKNDMEKPRRFYNGKIGVVKSLEDDMVLVECPDEETTIRLEREEWKNVQYSLNRQEQRIEERETGSFKQFPLRLAWAITIHKSQGLTFEKAIIDAGQAFAAGQVYVALSRCTNLEGMVLRSDIPSTAVFTDPRIVAFGARNQPADALSTQLNDARYNFQLQLLEMAFDGSALAKAATALHAFMTTNEQSFNAEALPWAAAFEEKCKTMAETAEKFSRQIRQMATPQQLPEDNQPLQERLKKAAAWFLPQLEELLTMIKQQPAITDSKEQALGFEQDLSNCFKYASQWQQLLKPCIREFKPEVLLKARSKVQIGELVGIAYAGNPKKRHEIAADHPHPELLRELRATRDDLSMPNNTPIYMIAGTQSLDEMARYLPQTAEELAKIFGFGKVKVEQFGAAFLEVIRNYCEAHGLESRLSEKLPKIRKKETVVKTTAKKGTTQKESFDLFMSGLSVEEIATTRNLVKSTIFGHLNAYVQQGDIPLEKLLDAEVQAAIEAAVLAVGPDSINAIKNNLPEGFDYSQIRIMRDWMVNRGQVTLTEKTEPAA